MLFSLKQEAPASIGGGTFTCPVCMKQEDVWEDIIDEMYNNLHTPFEISHYAVMNKTISEYPKKFGLAKCLADDVFNVEEGKRIAKRQLRDRINRCKLNFLDKMITKLEHETSSFFDREDSLYEKIYQSVCSGESKVIEYTVPMLNKIYFFVTVNGKVDCRTWENHHVDYCFYMAGNVFATKKEAKMHIDEFMEKYKKLKK